MSRGQSKNLPDVMPVVVVGVQHSGTTILNRMLGRHQDLGWFSQYSLRAGEVAGRRPLPGGNTTNRVLRKWLPVPWQKERHALSRLAPTPVDIEILRSWMPRGKPFLDMDDYTEELARELRDLVAREQAVVGAPRFLLKRPEFTRAVLLLSGIFPQAKFVHIIRDGKAIAHSIADKFARTPYGPANSVRDAAGFWSDTMNYMERCEAELPNRLLVLRYEDLCADVHGGLERILDFCELSRGGFEFDQLPKTLNCTNARRYSQYTLAERDMVDAIMEDALTARGYQTFAALDKGAAT